MKTVTLISKDDCSLCDKAFAFLEKMKKDIPFRLVTIKIEPGTDIYEKYKEKIPVLMIDGAEFFWYKMDEKKMRELLSVPGKKYRNNQPLK